MGLFAERLLIDPEAGSVPIPDRYDDALQVSVTTEGLPFVESVPHAQTVTLTEAEGEGVDHEPSEAPPAHRGSWGVTITRVKDEAPDAPMAPASRWGATMTKVQSEAPDAPTAAASSRQVDEPEASLWAITKTSAPGEKPDR
jgi:hypothetical protein